MNTRLRARVGLVFLAVACSCSGGCSAILAAAAAGMLVTREGQPTEPGEVMDETAVVVGDAAGQAVAEAVRETVRQAGDRAIDEAMPEIWTAQRVYEVARAAKGAADAARRTPVYVPAEPRATKALVGAATPSNTDAAERIAAHARLMDEVHREIAAQRAALHRLP